MTHVSLPQSNVISVGGLAPDFSLPVSDTREVSLSNIKGKFVVLYFYPKDDTPGCTIEAKDFNKLKHEFEKLEAIVIGVSKDSLDSHNKFKEKHCLDFDLASDADTIVCQKYGVWGEKSMLGKKYMGINRTTFLIDKDNRILHIWKDVSVKNHANDVLLFLQNFNTINKNV